MPAQHGFKQLSSDNWLSPDAVWLHFSWSLTGKDEAGQVWIADVLAPTLDTTVPIELAAMYEVARGAIAYGYLFYPLLTIGNEQLYRVLDAATVHKCRAQDVPASKSRSFQNRLAWLRENGFLSDQKFLRWDALRLLRNLTSHADQQNIYPPAWALQALTDTANDLNDLFRNAP